MIGWICSFYGMLWAFTNSGNVASLILGIIAIIVSTKVLLVVAGFALVFGFMLLVCFLNACFGRK